MNLLDNGDGTSTDVDTGDLYDSSTGSIVNAVPNASIFDFENDPGVSGTLIDSTGSNPINQTAQPVEPSSGGFFDVVNNLLGNVENTFTNLAPALQSAGVIQTPEARAQALAYQQQQQQLAQLQGQQIAYQSSALTAAMSSKNLIIYAVIGLAAIYLLKKN